MLIWYVVPQNATNKLYKYMVWRIAHFFNLDLAMRTGLHWPLTKSYQDEWGSNFVVRVLVGMWQPNSKSKTCRHWYTFGVFKWLIGIWTTYHQPWPLKCLSSRGESSTALMTLCPAGTGTLTVRTCTLFTPVFENKTGVFIYLLSIINHVELMVRD